MRNTSSFHNRIRVYVCGLLLSCSHWSTLASAQAPTAVKASSSVQSTFNEEEVLTPEQWRQVDRSVERALSWLANRQNNNGSFDTLAQGQPAVTSLCAMAFLAHGHLPSDDSPFGQCVRRAIDYAAACQKPNGLIAVIGPGANPIPRDIDYQIGVSTVYNHAISSLMLSEVYGLGGSTDAARLKPIIEKSLETSLLIQGWPKLRKIDEGGWRYIKPYNNVRSDLSLTGWQLMFLRSAKNSGFDVPQEPIDSAIGYIRRCFHPRRRVFEYTIQDGDGRSRAMAGAGVLAFAHAGLHNTQEARESGDWILKHPFDNYNRTLRFNREHQKDRYHYGVFNCTQAMYQLGGNYWQQFFPRITKTLLANQRANGSWDRENHREDSKFGNTYTTALVVLALGAPNQFLPVMQR